MAVIIARIDDRLIHGQVTVGWTRPNGINRVIVVNDALSKDPLQSMVLGLAAPPGVTVEIKPVEVCAEQLRSGALDNHRVMLIFTGPAEPLALIKAGVPVKVLNVGGMRYTSGRRKISTAVSVTPEEEAQFRDIMALGTAVEVRMFPADQKVDMATLLSKQ